MPHRAFADADAVYRYDNPRKNTGNSIHARLSKQILHCIGRAGKSWKSAAIALAGSKQPKPIGRAGSCQMPQRSTQCRNDRNLRTADASHFDQSHHEINYHCRVPAPFKVRDVLFGQFPVSAKVRHEGSHATIKQSAQKTFGFARDPFITLEYCGIQISSAIFLSADGSFVEQTIQ